MDAVLKTQMSSQPAAVRLVFPNQLFIEHLQADAGTTMVLVEDDLFFKQFPFHKQKLILHRASLKQFAEVLRGQGFPIVYLETSPAKSLTALYDQLLKIKPTSLSYYDVTDDWLQRKIKKLTTSLGLVAERLISPGFLTSPGLIDEYFDNNPNRMQYFYEWQRRRLRILMDGSKPVGGKWSYDVANRKKLPKHVSLPPKYPSYTSPFVVDAVRWVEQAFPDNPGKAETFSYPTSHQQAAERLQTFITERLSTFGPYEDAIVENEAQLFHSVLSPMLNCGLLTPRQVVDEVLSYADTHQVAIESLEGFIRQVIGWREYMRATYVRFGRKMRTSNTLQFNAKLSKNWWNGSVGLGPVDTTIKRVLDTGYAHHIERLMVLGNSMVLLRINPDEVYAWFMSLFIDAYDWVMVPNVYAMSQFAAGAMITTKPYISGSNYILKMSDYQKADWSNAWDALYWQFIADHREMIAKNYRMRMVLNIYDRFDDAKKADIKKQSVAWL